MVIPYYKGLSESLQKIWGKHGVQVYFKGGKYHQKPPGGPKGPRSNPQTRVGSSIETGVAG